ncbi:unnamed protein product, partial [marine sediment metagenome]
MFIINKEKRQRFSIVISTGVILAVLIFLYFGFFRPW